MIFRVLMKYNMINLVTRVFIFNDINGWILVWINII
jgi:hypothetical protein